MKYINKMKKLSTYLFLILFSFSTPSFADDISDFQIEGMSIGDSLLDYYDKEDIESRIKNRPYYYPGSKKFVVIAFYLENKNTFYQLHFHIKTKDKKFIIHSLKGVSDKPLNECLNIKKDVVKEISEIMPNAKKKDYTNDYEKSYGKSKAYINEFYLSSGSIRAWCVKWDKTNVNTNKKWNDGLNVAAGDNVYLNFIQNEAYK